METATETTPTLEEVAEEYGLVVEAFTLYCDNHHIRGDYEDVVRDFENSYVGWREDGLAEYASELLAETYDHHILRQLERFIDWDKVAEEYRHDYWCEDGHVFRQ